MKLIKGIALILAIIYIFGVIVSVLLEIQEYYVSTKRDEQIQAFKEVCSQKDWETCFQLGILERGAGNVGEASRLYKLACEHGIWQACYTLADHLRLENIDAHIRNNTQKLGEVTRLFKLACEHEVWQGCYESGYLENKAGNLGEASRLYKLACEHEIWDGCFDLGIFEARANNLGEAKRLFNLACEHGISLGCDGLEKLFSKAIDSK